MVFIKTPTIIIGENNNVIPYLIPFVRIKITDHNTKIVRYATTKFTKYSPNGKSNIGL